MINLPYLLESNAHLLSDKMGPEILCMLELSMNEQHRHHITIGNKMAASYALQPLSNGHCRKNKLVALQPFARIASVVSVSLPVPRVMTPRHT